MFLLNPDLQMIDDADSEEDLMLVVNVLRTFLKSNYAMTEDFSSCVTTLFGTCYVLNSVRVANELWHDPELSQFLLGTTTHMRYLMLLYKNGHYDSLGTIPSLYDFQTIVDQQNRQQNEHTGWSIWSDSWVGLTSILFVTPAAWFCLGLWEIGRSG